MARRKKRGARRHWRATSTPHLTIALWICRCTANSTGAATSLVFDAVAAGGRRQRLPGAYAWGGGPSLEMTMRLCTASQEGGRWEPDQGRLLWTTQRPRPA